MKVLFVSGEGLPFSSTGGLADVIGSLPKALAASAKEDDIRVVLPLYATTKEKFADELNYEFSKTVNLAWRHQYCGVYTIKRDGVTYYFIDNEYYFKRSTLYGQYDDGERFAFFSRAVIDILPDIDFFPDILHCNDWQSALAILYLRLSYSYDERYRQIKTLYTIHNIEYQGKFGLETLGDLFGLDERDRSVVEYNHCVNLTKGAIVCADRVTTVSERYASEIQTEFYASGLHYVLRLFRDKVCGITNGIDEDYYNPKKDPIIARQYDAETIELKKECKRELQELAGLPVRDDVPLVAMISRLTAHKGFDLVKYILPEMLTEDRQFILLGTGEPELENFFRNMQSMHPKKVRAFIQYDKDLSKKIYAGADMFLMPSKSEPCGLAQMICSEYGTVPIVRETGGLADTIQPYNRYTGEGNGFTFRNYNAHEMKDAVERAEELYRDKEKWKQFCADIMKIDFSWNVSAEKYRQIYQSLLD